VALGDGHTVKAKGGLRLLASAKLNVHTCRGLRNGGTSDGLDLNGIPGRTPPTSPEDGERRWVGEDLDLGGMRIEKKGEPDKS